MQPVDIALAVIVGLYVAAFVTLRRKGYWND